MQRIMLLSIIAALILAAPGYAQDDPVRNAYGGAAEVPGAIARAAGSTGDVAGEIARGGGSTGDVAGEIARGGERANGGNFKSAAPAARPTAPVAAAQPLRGNELPFTGLDMALLALGGGTLLALGFALRHVGHGPAA